MKLNQEIAQKFTINGQEVIIETSAQLRDYNILRDGKLILTKNHLIFRDKLDGVIVEIPLSNIHSIRLLKQWGVFTKGIKCYYDNKVFTVFVGFPRDWLRLIVKQQKVHM